MIDLDQLQAIIGRRDEDSVAVYPDLVETMPVYGIDTPEREAMFLSQAIHETGGFRWLEEIASGQAYENREDLGNTEPGDGVKFKGRGIFQLTGRANYARCSQALFDSERALIDHPELVAEPITAVASACWYWQWKGLNKLADKRDVMGVTRKINGGLNGLADRQRLYNRALFALGLRSNWT
jgi:putative chitinase